MEWETVIGLEVHVQLATQSKIFSGSSTAFGAAPNTQANLVDVALPGILPVPNEQAFRYAVMFGLAVNADIGKRSVFERKNYFYPDLPKGYQTTQLAEPIVGPGYIDITLENGDEKRIRIHHAHLEEDAGKSLHEDYHGMSGIDLNRAGTPLIEVVTEPDMRSADEAVACARKLHAIVTSLGICDGEMAQGSMRFDVNISVRPKGQQEYGTRTETKNLNSFKFMEKAIYQEVERQIEVIEDGGEIIQQTRLYDGETHTAKAMRSKEEANDYRYFPCPDLLPVILDAGFIADIEKDMPELPDARKMRFQEQYELNAYDSGVLSADAQVANYFEATAKTSEDAKLSANWIMGELSKCLNAEDLSITQSKVTSEQLAQLILRIKDGTLTSKLARQVFEHLWNGESDVDAIIEKQGLKTTGDDELAAIVDEIIANNSKQVENYLAADESRRKKMVGFFVGQVMKATGGQADPQKLNALLQDKLK